MNTIKNWIPNLLTLGNLTCGMLACWLAANLPDSFSGPDASMAERWIHWSPSILIFGAAIIDFLDGFVARLLKVQSELGKQLDSLADVVSFGVAPSFVVIGNEYLGAWSPLGLLIGIFACVRLAKFNIDTRQSDSFLGLPVPSTGMIIAALPFVDSEGMLGFMLHPWFIGILVVVLCLLMVSELPLLAMKFKTFGIKENLARYAIVLMAVLLLIFFGIQAIVLIIPGYVLISVLARK